MLTSRWFTDWLVSCGVNMACLDRNVVLPMQQCGVHKDEGVTPKECVPLAPSVNHHQFTSNQWARGTKHCMKRTYQMCVVNFYCKKEMNVAEKGHLKMEHIRWHVRCLCGTEIHHACHNSELFCDMWFQYCKFRQCQIQ